jgi:hypothetical protein
MFDQALTQLAAYAKVRPPVAQMKQALEAGLEGLRRGDIEKRLRAIEQAIEATMKRTELNGPVYEDLVVLKSLHARYRRELESSDRREGGGA